MSSTLKVRLKAADAVVKIAQAMYDDDVWFTEVPHRTVVRWDTKLQAAMARYYKTL